MAKKRIIIAVIAVIVTVAFVILWNVYRKDKQIQEQKNALKASPGFHAVDGRAYAHFSGLCYVFDDEGQILSQSAMVLDGEETEDASFAGELMVMGYEVTEGGYIEGKPAVQKWDGGIWSIFDHKTCRHNERDEQGMSKWVEHPVRYAFTYYMREDDSRYLAVLIYDTEAYEYYVVILADTEDDAYAGYHWFKENKPEG